MRHDDPPQLKRALSLTLVSFYGIGTILGAGIYVLVGKVAGLSGKYTLLAFVIASLVAAFSAFSYAELAARYPKSAGEAVYIEHGFHWPLLSRLVGLLIVLVGAVSTATLIHGFVGYLSVFVQWPATWVIVVVISIMVVIVIWGISQSVLIAALMTVIEIAGLVIIVWVARSGFSLLPDQLIEFVPPLKSQVWAGILLGAFIAFYAFIGFEDIVNVAEEVRNPERNVPRAIVIALTVTTLFYVLVAMLSVLVMSPQRLAASDAPLAMIYQQTTGQYPLVITIISLVSVLNGALIQIIMGSRVLYGMNRQGWLPSRLGDVHPFTHTPMLAILTMGGVIMLFALVLPLLSLAKLTSFITLLIFVLVNAALWRIKFSQRQSYAGFQTPLWVPVSGSFVSAALLLFQIFHSYSN